MTDHFKSSSYEALSGCYFFALRYCCPWARDAGCRRSQKEILQLKEDVQVIQLNLVKGEARLQRGIVVAAVGFYHCRWAHGGAKMTILEKAAGC